MPTTIGSNSDACSHTWTQHSGVVHTLTNALDQQRIETYDVLGQLVTAVTQANDNVTPTTTTHFAHDPFGNLVQTVDPANNPINIAYDVMGRKTDLTDPDLGHIHYDVDPVGRTWRQISPIESTATQATAQATIMQYDVLDRMVQRIEPDLASVWVYDVPAGTAATACAATTSCGELVESYTAPLTSPGVLNTSAKTIDTTHTYTNVGLPLQSVKTLDTTTGNVFTTTLGYDGWSRLITTIHQQAVTNTTKQFGQRYNGLGYLNLVEREFGTPTATQAQILWQPTAQDASNRVTQAQLGNGLYDNRCYDAGTGFLGDGTLANATTTCSTSPATLDLQEAYSYDKLGNVVTRTQAWNSGIATGSTSSPVAPTQFTEAFTYDGLNRLTSSTVVGGMQQDFTYDVVGNLTSKTGTSTGNYHYLTNRVTQPHAVAAIDNMGSFSYDADGNQLGGNGRTTTWSSFDMPVSISRSGNSSTFAYGPDHERTSQLESNANIQSKVFYGGAQEVQLDGSGNLVSVKTYWPNGLGVEIDKPNQSTTELDWTHTDRLGSIVAITDVHGNLKEALGFDAWGSRRIANGDTGVTPGTAQVTETTDDKGYTGQEMLDPLELVHLNGRVYDPLIGKFISGDPHITDPMNGQNYNRYSYVLNNPTNDTDPTGFDTTGSNLSNSQVAPAFVSCSGSCGSGSGSGYASATQSQSSNALDPMNNAQYASTVNSVSAAAGTGSGNSDQAPASGQVTKAVAKNDAAISGTPFASTGGRDPRGFKSAAYDTGKAVWNSAIDTVNFGIFVAGVDNLNYFGSYRANYDTPAFGYTVEILAPFAASKLAGAAGATSAAQFGNATSNAYRDTFFAANPELRGQVVVHHAVEQGVLSKFPGVVSDAEMHSLENLRGIPNEINSDVHLSQIRIEWNRFYKPFIESGASPTKEQLLQKATQIDDKFGTQFMPPVR